MSQPHAHINTTHAQITAESISEHGAPPGVIVPKRWRRLALAIGPLAADTNESSVLTTLAPVIISTLALPVAALSIMFSVSRAVGMVFGPVWAYVSRKTNRKYTLFVTTVCAALATALTGASQDYVQLLVLFGLSAVFIAAALPIVSEITADLFDDRSRSRASGVTWGTIALIGSITSPLLGQLANANGGWRYGFFIWGAGTLVVAVLVLFLKDPGVGASEGTTPLATAAQRRKNERITLARIFSLFAIPTFVAMLVQRLLAGQLIVTFYSVLFLVEVRGFDTATAALVLLPFGVGYLVGTVGGGFVADALERRSWKYGRAGMLQFAQFAIAITVIVATQFDWKVFGVYLALWGVLGVVQGLNPALNRPIVAAVVPPELRSTAFALMLSVFEALAFVIFNLIAASLLAVIGLQGVMLWIPGILMLVNGAFVTVLYWTYPRDVVRLNLALLARTEPSGVDAR